MYIFPIIIVLLIIWFIAAYNGLIRLATQTDEAWADIDVQLKRRYDLIPNLVETVKGYAAHEQGTLQKVIDARSKAMGAQSIEDRASAENMVSSALKSVFALAEAYPQLRAVEGFTKLQDELTDTEDKIQAARRFYNGNVRDLNTRILSFPNNMVASMFHFVKREFFELGASESAAKDPVKVSF